MLAPLSALGAGGGPYLEGRSHVVLRIVPVSTHTISCGTPRCGGSFLPEEKHIHGKSGYAHRNKRQSNTQHHECDKETAVNPGGMDMQALLQQAQQMQQQLVEAQQALDDTEIEGSSGGGLVKVKLSGRGQVEDITVDPKAIDPGDSEETAQTLADLVLAAIRDAEAQVERIQEEKMGPLAEGLGGGMPGGGIPGLPGM